VERFPENLRRLLGLHDLEQTEAAEMLGMSKQSFSAWNSGRRTPSFTTALLVADFLGVAADRLARASFEDLLAHELADPDRFREVEAEIRRRRSTLKAVDDKPGPANKFKTARKVTAMDEARAAQRLRREGRSEAEIEEVLKRGRAKDEDWSPEEAS
jgi:transcriptional regulator with XRE-family HTH domain